MCKNAHDLHFEFTKSQLELVMSEVTLWAENDEASIDFLFERNGITLQAGGKSSFYRDTKRQ